jgi:putative tryptophan/tyrosine transport system substrate-binding protein
MRRRDLAFLICAAMMAPRALFAQATGKRFRVGWMFLSTKDAPIPVKYLGQFLSGMGELDHIEGQGFEMLDSFADFDADRLTQLAVELVQLKPDVIVAASSIIAVPLIKASDRVPIVVGAPR